MQIGTSPHSGPEFLAPGEPVDLSNCAREPIHTPGGIQPHGAVLVARLTDLAIVQLSSNTEAILGSSPDELLGRRLDAICGVDAVQELAAAARRASGPRVQPHRLRIDGRAVDVHPFQPAPQLLALDVEPAPQEELAPLAAVGRLTEWTAGLQAAGTINEVLGAAAAALRQLTGCDRAWGYRFADDGHGIVEAEDRADHLDSLLGLHFPEGDIPAQARALYLQNGVRVIPEVPAMPAPLIPTVNPETGEHLDLSASGLRAVSPMHLRYLANMGVASSLSVPLAVDGRLWGLLSGHHYGGPLPLPMGVRAECEVLGRIASMQIGLLREVGASEHRAALAANVSTVVEHVVSCDDLVQGLRQDEAALLGLCDASGAILALNDELVRVGRVPSVAECRQLLGALPLRTRTPVAWSSLQEEAPALARLARVAAGVLALPIAPEHGHWIVWLRPEHLQEVTWANRDKGLAFREPDADLDLGYRESFERWVEEVRGTARPWERDEVEAVQRLGGALGSLLLGHTNRLAQLNGDLARANAELDAFAYAAAHDLRVPTHAIRQLASLVLTHEGEAISTQSRADLHAVGRLAVGMDGLLSSLLQYAKIGETPWAPRSMPLPELVEEARELLGDRWPDGTELSVDEIELHGDPSGVRQLLLNLLWNAVKYSDDTPRIHVGAVPLTEAPGAPLPGQITSTPGAPRPSRTSCAMPVSASPRRTTSASFGCSNGCILAMPMAVGMARGSRSCGVSSSAMGAWCGSIPRSGRAPPSTSRSSRDERARLAARAQRRHHRAACSDGRGPCCPVAARDPG